MLTDPIADMLTRIRNANKALHEKATMPSSKMKVELAHAGVIPGMTKSSW